MMCSYSIENFLLLRVCLSVGCACFALWGLTATPMLLDTAMFNSVMLLLNLRHAVILAYQHRHIDFARAYEQIYVNVFEGYLNRSDFAKLVDISMIRREKRGEVFKTKGDEITSLCVLVKGRMSILRPDADRNADLLEENSSYARLSGLSSRLEDESDSDIEQFVRNPCFVNLCQRNQFIEAPQWVACNLKPDGERFTVSFVAVDDCEYIKWPKESLVSLIDSNASIFHALSGVLGLHTAHALLKSRQYNKIQAELSGKAKRAGPAMVKESHLNHSRVNDADIDEEEEEEQLIRVTDTSNN